MAKIEPFEKHLENYEQWFLDNPRAYVSEIQAVKSLLPTAGEGLEIGVGTGRFAAPLKIRRGVEPSKRMAAVARRRGVEVTTGTAEKLPFESETFDFALMVTTICFVDDPRAALREAFRVLKKGGSLIVALVDRESPLGQNYLKRQAKSLFYREATFHSTSEVVEIMQQSGFGDFAFAQTLFRPLEEIAEKEPVRHGHGEGSFVAIRGTVPASGT